MHKKNEILNIVLNFAKSDENIRAVLLEGSRANPNGKIDKLSDYDIAFVTHSNKPYLDKYWFDAFAAKFGEVAILQTPDNPKLFDNAHNPEQHFAYLTLFNSGLRMDMTFETMDFLNTINLDSATVVLLDKDNKFSNIVSSDSDFLINPPTKNKFKACQNEFWWCLQNVAKGIVRDELTYAMRMFDIVHVELEKMVKWYIGLHSDFKVSTGTFGRYFKDFLPENFYKMYEKTYSDSNYENLWNAVFKACELFRILAKEIALKLSFTYNQSEDNGVTKYLKILRSKSNAEN